MKTYEMLIDGLLLGLELGYEARLNDEEEQTDFSPCSHDHQ